MDPRIGILSNGRCYAFVNGYAADAIVGSLAEIEVALGLPVFAPSPSHEPAKRALWDVRLSFEFPAWDEIDGIWYRDVEACSKSQANAIVRRRAHADGHLCGGRGRNWLQALPAASAR